MKSRFLGSAVFLLLLTVGCGRFGRDEPPTPDVHALQERTLEALWTTVNDNYVYESFDGVDWEEVRGEYLGHLDEAMTGQEFTELMDAMLGELPNGTASREPRDERIARVAEDDSSYEGIGSFVAIRGAPEPRILLLSVMSGSPAEQAGLRTHDAVLAIDGIPVSETEGADAVSRVRGPAGSDVTLSVRSPGEETRDVIVTRGRILTEREPVSLSMLDGTSIGYSLFPPVNYDDMFLDFVTSVEDAENELEGLIIDLRIVSSGSGWPVTSMLSLFTNGAVGEVYSRNESNVFNVQGVTDFLEHEGFPIAVLVGPNTTGSAEIFAASLRARENSILIGKQTPGEVEAFSSYFLPDGSRAFVATSSFRTEDGVELGLTGLTPDIMVDNDWDAVTDDDDAVLDAAVEAILRIR